MRWDDTISKDTPSTSIQWKGTDVCMDWHCTCGYHNHIDTDFLYFVKCYSCKLVFEVGTRVAMRLTTDKDSVERAKESDPPVTP